MESAFIRRKWSVSPSHMWELDYGFAVETSNTKI